MFQSLLWWIAVVNVEPRRPGSSRDRVSILVVVDCSRQPAPLLAKIVRDEGVSILVVVDCSRQQQAGPWTGRRSKAGFNPCCGGLQSSTSGSGVDVAACRRFQSLLWWIAVVNDAVAAGVHEIAIVSILVVVDCSRQPRIASELELNRTKVSILVVVDCSRQRRGGVDCGPDRFSVSILVVVDCSRQQRRAEPVASRSRLGFNPCCGGLQSSTTFEARRVRCDRPVSILVVVDCSRQRLN